MGACDFASIGYGCNAKEAFRTCREEALHYYGHRGYTGSIAEKDSFVMINNFDKLPAEEYAMQLIDEGDRRISNKWGPAGCIRKSANKYLFFGIASC